MTSRLSRLLQGKHHYVWKQFAIDVGGEFVEGGAGGHDTVRLDVQGRRAMLEEDVTMVLIGKSFVPVVSTRFFVNLPAVPAYRFSMSAEGVSARFARWFGAQDIAVGDSAFDHAFVLKGVEPSFVQQLFADSELRALCVLNFSGRLQRRDDVELWSDPTPGEDPFELSVMSLVDDLSTLHAYFDIFLRVLARFPDAASASAPPSPAQSAS